MDKKLIYEIKLQAAMLKKESQVMKEDAFRMYNRAITLSEEANALCEAIAAKESTHETN